MGVRKDRAKARKEGSTPGWLHQCKGVGHEVWTVQGATCAFCGAFNHQRKERRA